MKRLLAMFLAWIVALFNSVDYATQGDMNFARGEYYTIEEAEAPDYRNLYGNTPVNSAESACSPTRFSGSGQPVRYNDNSVIHEPLTWIVNRQSIIADDSTATELDEVTYTFTDTSFILAPYTGTLGASSVTSDGHDMRLDIQIGNNSYVMLISNMDRWWCCLGKVQADQTNDKGEDVWVHTCSELYGTRFTAGQVLGKAKVGTTVTFQKKESGQYKNVTLREFFTQ